MTGSEQRGRAVLGVFIRALLTFERRRAERRGVAGGRGGAVTAIQRFGSVLNLNVDFHTVAVQGVFVDDGSGGLRFVPNPEPSDSEVDSIAIRIARLAKRRGIELDPIGSFTDSQGNVGYLEIDESGVVRLCNENEATPAGDQMTGYVWANANGDEPTKPTYGNEYVGAGDADGEGVDDGDDTNGTEGDDCL